MRRLVHSAWETPGAHSVEWDGRDSHGRVLAGGVYFSRIEAAGTRGRYRVVRVR